MPGRRRKWRPCPRPRGAGSAAPWRGWRRGRGGAASWPPGASRWARSPSNRYGRARGIGQAACCRNDAELGGCLNIPRSKAPRVQLAALSWGSGQTSLSPCQFLRRQQVLQLYRKILRAIREVPAEQDRRYLKDWAREEFRRNKDATEEVRIGNPQLWSPALGNGRCTVLSCVLGVCFVAVASKLVTSLLLLFPHLCEEIIRHL